MLSVLVEDISWVACIQSGPSLKGCVGQPPESTAGHLTETLCYMCHMTSGLPRAGKPRADTIIWEHVAVLFLVFVLFLFIFCFRSVLTFDT